MIEMISLSVNLFLLLVYFLRFVIIFNLLSFSFIFNQCTAIGPGAQNLYYDKISKDLIIKNIQIHTREKLKKLFRKYHLRKQDSAFRLWREKSEKKSVQPIVIQKNEIIIKKTITNSAWTLNIIKSKRKSLAIMITVYLQHCNNCVERKFRFWKNYTKSQKYLVIKYFDKWNIKTSRTLLNKMNMIRFIQILGNRIVHYQRKKLLPRWKQFKKNCEFLKTMAHVKLLFICWKTTTLAMKEGRGRRLKYFFQFWRGQVTCQKDDDEVSNLFFVLSISYSALITLCLIPFYSVLSINRSYSSYFCCLL